jgi:hypothetical protein
MSQEQVGTPRESLTYTMNSCPRSASHVHRCFQSGIARSTARQNAGV